MSHNFSLSLGQSSLQRPTAWLTTAMVLGGMLASLAAPVEARPRNPRALQNSNRVVNTNPYPYAPANVIGQQFDIEVPGQTMIPVRVDQGQITLRRGETISATLRTANPLRTNNGSTVIPAGSQIIGQFRPINNNTAMQFVAQQLVLSNGQYVPINARSRELVGFQTRNIGASASDVIMGTLAGAGTATIISGTTGDRRITPLEVLGGAAVGALAGWGLPSAGIVGGGSEEILTVSNQDLTLMLQSPLRISTNQPSPAPRGGAWNTATW